MKIVGMICRYLLIYILVPKIKRKIAQIAEKKIIAITEKRIDKIIYGKTKPKEKGYDNTS